MHGLVFIFILGATGPVIEDVITNSCIIVNNIADIIVHVPVIMDIVKTMHSNMHKVISNPKLKTHAWNL